MEINEFTEFFEMDELNKIFNNQELFISLDVLDKTNGFETNIFENKSIKLDKFPNTLHQIGKKYSCEKKIMKLKRDNCDFIYKIKFEKKGVFEMSVTLHF